MTTWGRLAGSFGIGISVAAVYGAFLSPAGRAQAQLPPAALISPAQQAECLAFGDAHAARGARAGIVRSITTGVGRAIPHPRPLDTLGPADAAARSFLAVCGSLFGVDEPAGLTVRNQRSQLRIADDGRFAGRHSTVRFQQHHQGIPVIGGELVVDLDDANNVLFAGGKALTNRPADVDAAIDASEAVTTAIELVAKHHSVAAQDLIASRPELWIYDPALIGPGTGPSRPVWRLEVTPRRLLPIRELVLVDATTGGVPLHFNQVDSALSRATYTAGGVQTTPGTLVCNETNPTCSGGDVDAVGAHVSAGDTYNFYAALGRNGIDNAGMTIVSTVHYGVNFQNAFWNGTQMVYGDGYPQADDVVGHELTHGVTQFTSGLFYYYQSGAINESLSDVFGELIDQGNSRGTDTAGVKWLIGEDIPGTGALRSMSNPPAFSDPDKMTSPLYSSTQAYDAQSFDNGGVHTNSGINNKAAYLMTDGGTFNGQVVVGIGAAKVARIYYAVQSLLISGSDYGDLHEALFQACNNLVGTAGILSTDCLQVRNATLAVEMNLQPTVNANPEAPICDNGQPPQNLFFDTFESGTSNFTMAANTGTVRWSSGAPGGPFTHSGTHAVYAPDTPASINDSWVAMASGVTLPANAFLHFAHAFGFEFDPTTFYDGGVLEYSINGGSTWTDASSLIQINGYGGTLDSRFSNPLGGRRGFVGDSHGYISTRASLATLAGQTVRFRWRMGLDISGSNRGWWLDDVRLYTCVSGVVTADSVTPASGSGTTQTFTFKYSDSIGATDLATAWAWFSPNAQLPNSCAAYVERATNKVFLADDAGSTYSSALIGSGSILQNGQCSLQLSGASLTLSGNTLTWNQPVTFKSAFAGAKTTSLFAASVGSSNSGWQARGTWTVPSGGPSTPTITWPAPASITYGTALGATQLNATANTAGTFAYTPSSGTVLSAGSQTLSVVFTPTDTTNWTTASATVPITVAKATPVIVWPPPANITVGTALSATQLNANSPVPGTFAYNPTAGTVLPLGANQTLGVTFTPTDTANYNTATASVTINVVSAPTPTVTADSSTPSSGTGNARTFDFKYSDSAGMSDLTSMWVWITPSIGSALTNTCMLFYDRVGAKLYLLNDAATTWLSSPIPASGALQNNQCAVMLSGSSVSGTGNTATLHLPMTFTTNIAGTRNVYLYATGSAGANSGWQSRGTWTIPSTLQVTADSVTPSSGTGVSQSFTFQYTDTAGLFDLSRGWAWFTANATPSGSSVNSCLVYYDRPTAKVFLLNDAGTTYTSGSIPGAGTLSNSQCSINLASSSASGAGNTLTVTLAMTFTPAYAGAKNIFMFGGGTTAGSSGWLARGTWTISSTVITVTADSVTPSSGSGMAQSFAFQYSDSAGATDLTKTWVFFSPSLSSSSASSCMLYFDRAANSLFLLNDAGTVWLSGIPGASGTLANSQCSIALGGSSVIPSGTTQTMTLAVTFAPSFAGTKSIFMFAAGSTPSANSGWQTRGSWTIPAAATVVTADSVTPGSGTGASQTFAVQFSDSAGAADLKAGWVFFNPNAVLGSLANTCLLYYDKPTNSVLLLNDAASAWASHVIGSGTLANSQCSINLAASSVTLGATTLTLNAAVTFASPAFSGTKNVYLFGSGTSTDSGWVNRGTWTVP